MRAILRHTAIKSDATTLLLIRFDLKAILTASRPSSVTPHVSHFPPPLPPLSQQHRYRVMHFACTDAFERQYDASGRETAIVQSERTKIRTGYLNSSYQASCNPPPAPNCVSPMVLHPRVARLALPLPIRALPTPPPPPPTGQAAAQRPPHRRRGAPPPGAHDLQTAGGPHGSKLCLYRPRG